MTHGGESMLKDEFSRLMKLFHEGADGKNLNLEEVFALSLDFFKDLKTQMEKGTPEEKQEAMAMMAQLYTQIMAESKKITERSGLSEDQLLNFAENPANFSPEQWKAIQESKRKISQAGLELAKAIEKSTKPPTPEEKDKKPSHGKVPKKSKWMRS